MDTYIIPDVIIGGDGTTGEWDSSKYRINTGDKKMTELKQLKKDYEAMGETIARMEKVKFEPYESGHVFSGHFHDYGKLPPFTARQRWDSIDQLNLQWQLKAFFDADYEPDWEGGWYLCLCYDHSEKAWDWNNGSLEIKGIPYFSSEIKEALDEMNSRFPNG